MIVGIIIVNIYLFNYVLHQFIERSQSKCTVVPGTRIGNVLGPKYKRGPTIRRLR